MEIARTENIESEGLVKHYDSQDRLVKIEFTRSGNSCTIQYSSAPALVSAFSLPYRRVTWSNGYGYLVYNKSDTTKFIAIPEKEKIFWKRYYEKLIRHDN